MGIKRLGCEQCNHTKETHKHLCKYPDQWRKKMDPCSGWAPYDWNYQQAAEWIIHNYKTPR